MTIPMDRLEHIRSLERELSDLLEYVKKMKRSPYPESDKVFLTQVAINYTHRALKSAANPDEANKEFHYKGAT